ncbi:MAG: hypothetical protein WD801_00220 [Gemmatimonadaceae bacterium]
MIDTVPRPEASLPEFLAARARHASDSELTVDAVGGLVATMLVIVWRGPGWELLLAVSTCVGAFGTWGIADRELGEQPDAPRRRAIMMRALRILSAGIGFAAVAFLLMALLARSLGRIIS